MNAETVKLIHQIRNIPEERNNSHLFSGNNLKLASAN